MFWSETDPISTLHAMRLAQQSPTGFGSDEGYDGPGQAGQHGCLMENGLAGEVSGKKIR